MGIINNLLSDPGLVNQIWTKFRTMRYDVGENVPRFPVEFTCYKNMVFKGSDIRFTRDSGCFLNNRIMLSAVIWQSSFVSLIESHYDAISFEFSGCLMARFKMDGRYYAAHIHCDANRRDDSRYAWSNFIYLHRNRISDLTIFQPGHCLGKLKNTWGIIERDGTCYTVILEESQDGETVEILDIIRHERYGSRIDDYSILQQFAQIPQGTTGDETFKTQRDKLNNFWKTRTWEVIYSKNSYNGC